VPDRPFVDSATMKPRFGWQGKRVILTFGLLAPDKGIDDMIRAMPAVAARHPDALYVVLGATHPNLVREQGEALRDGLMTLSRELGVADHVHFINSYVEQEELLDYLQAADIYVTPYVNPAQVVSGTLSYAIGMGKPVLSTPYVQALEILSDDRGVVVPFRDPEALAKEIDRLLSDDGMLAGYARRAYAYGRRMIWSELARHVGDLFQSAVATFPGPTESAPQLCGARARSRRNIPHERCHRNAPAQHPDDPRPQSWLLRGRQCPGAHSHDADAGYRCATARPLDDGLCQFRSACLECGSGPVPQLHGL